MEYWKRDRGLKTISTLTPTELPVFLVFGNQIAKIN